MLNLDSPSLSQTPFKQQNHYCYSNQSYEGYNSSQLSSCNSQLIGQYLQQYRGQILKRIADIQYNISIIQETLEEQQDIWRKGEDVQDSLRSYGMLGKLQRILEIGKKICLKGSKQDFANLFQYQSQWYSSKLLQPQKQNLNYNNNKNQQALKRNSKRRINQEPLTPFFDQMLINNHKIEQIQQKSVQTLPLLVKFSQQLSKLKQLQSHQLINIKIEPSITPKRCLRIYKSLLQLALDSINSFAQYIYSKTKKEKSQIKKLQHQIRQLTSCFNKEYASLENLDLHFCQKYKTLFQTLYINVLKFI